MEIITSAIPGVAIFKPRVFNDARGYFFESYSQREFERLMEEAGFQAYMPQAFVQDNQSSSQGGVMRGLHFQRPPFTQAKLVRCVIGSVLDVAVDVRRGSPTYGQHVAVELTAENHLQLYIPRGFAHGFAVLSPTAVFQYKCDNYYSPEHDGGISILDSALGIDWRVDPAAAILSEKDTRHPALADFDTPFEF